VDEHPLNRICILGHLYVQIGPISCFIIALVLWNLIYVL